MRCAAAADGRQAGSRYPPVHAVRAWPARKQTASRTIVRHCIFVCVLSLVVQGLAVSPAWGIQAGGANVAAWSATELPLHSQTKTPTRTLTAAATSQSATAATGGSADGSTQQIAFPVSSVVFQTGHTNAVTCVAFSPVDPSLLASGSVDNTIRLWNASTMTQLLVLTGQQAAVSSIAFNSNGTLLASSDSNGGIVVWSVPQQSKLFSIATLPDGLQLSGLSFSPDGRLLSAGTAYSYIIGKRRKAMAAEGSSSTHAALKAVMHAVHFAGSDAAWLHDFWLQSLGPTRSSTSGSRAAAAGPHHNDDAVHGSSNRSSVNGTSKAGSSTDSGSGRRRALQQLSSDNFVIVWDMTTQLQVANLTGHTDQVTSTAFSPQASILASGSNDGSIRLWATNSDFRLVGRLTGQSLVSAVAWHPDGYTLASASASISDRSVDAWDVRFRKLLASMAGHVNGVTGVAFAPSGALLASSSLDNTVRLWDPSSWSPLQVLSLSGVGSLTSVTISADSAVLAAGSNDRSIRLWTVPQGVSLGKLQKQGVQSLAFSPAEDLFAVGLTDSSIQLFNQWTRQLVTTLVGHSWTVVSLSFSQNGLLLASADVYSSARLWDVSQGVQVGVINLDVGVQCYAAALSPDGSLLALGWNSDVILWDVQGRRQLTTLSGHQALVRAAAFSPDGSLLATGAQDNHVLLWDTSAQVAVGLLLGHESGVATLAWSPDGTALATGSYDATVRLWNVWNQTATAVLYGHTSAVLSVTFSPDGSLLASCANDGTVRLWDVAAEQQLQVIQAHGTNFVNQVAFSREGALLGSAGDDSQVLLYGISPWYNQTAPPAPPAPPQQPSPPGPPPGPPLVAARPPAPSASPFLPLPPLVPLRSPPEPPAHAPAPASLPAPVTPPSPSPAPPGPLPSLTPAAPIRPSPSPAPPLPPTPPVAPPAPPLLAPAPPPTFTLRITINFPSQFTAQANATALKSAVIGLLKSSDQAFELQVLAIQGGQVVLVEMLSQAAVDFTSNSLRKNGAAFVLAAGLPCSSYFTVTGQSSSLLLLYQCSSQVALPDQVNVQALCCSPPLAPLLPPPPPTAPLPPPPSPPVYPPSAPHYPPLRPSQPPPPYPPQPPPPHIPPPPPPYPPSPSPPSPSPPRPRLPPSPSPPAPPLSPPPSPSPHPPAPSFFLPVPPFPPLPVPPPAPPPPPQQLTITIIQMAWPSPADLSSYNAAFLELLAQAGLSRNVVGNATVMQVPGSPPEARIQVALDSQAAVDVAAAYFGGNLQYYVFSSGMPCGSTVIVAGQVTGPTPYSCSGLVQGLAFLCCAPAPPVPAPRPLPPAPGPGVYPGHMSPGLSPGFQQPPGPSPAALATPPGPPEPPSPAAGAAPSSAGVTVTLKTKSQISDLLGLSNGVSGALAAALGLPASDVQALHTQPAGGPTPAAARRAALEGGASSQHDGGPQHISIAVLARFQNAAAAASAGNMLAACASNLGAFLSLEFIKKYNVSAVVSCTPISQATSI